jgi:galactose mutarotase-like enzyme
VNCGSEERPAASGRTGIGIASGAGAAEVTTAGAELRAWRVGGEDLLWTGDAAVWDGVAPVLFPVVGWTRNGEVRVDGRVYPLGLHGFARHRRFEVRERQADSVTLVLGESEETLRHYPFPFRLAVTYAVAGATLAATLEITNTGDRPMPYAAGLHPGFRCPLPGSGPEPHHIAFDAAERSTVPVIAPGGLFSQAERPSGVAGRVLTLSAETFAHEALCFIGARSRGLELASRPEGGPRLRVAFEGLPNIVLWSRPAAPFLCIEGWSGSGDPEGYAGELADKPGMILLAPGETGRHAMHMAYTGVAGRHGP